MTQLRDNHGLYLAIIKYFNHQYVEALNLLVDEKGVKWTILHNVDSHVNIPDKIYNM